MGTRLTAFENRSRLVVEIRVFVPPARPDHYRKIIRIKPGEMVEVIVKAFCYEDTERHAIFMVYMNGESTGVNLVPEDLVHYAKIICDGDDNGRMHIRGIRAMFTDCCGLKCCCGFFLGKHCCGMPEEEIT